MKILKSRQKIRISVSFLSVFIFDGSRKNMTHCKRRQKRVFLVHKKLIFKNIKKFFFQISYNGNLSVLFNRIGRRL